MTGAVRASLVIASDRVARGEREDLTAPKLQPLLAAHRIELVQVLIVPDERAAIAAALLAACGASEIVLTSGGTGIAPRDVTVEATRDVIEREVPGIGEAMRAASAAKVRTAMLSRATAGVRGHSLIVNLPGSPRGAMECLEVVLPVIPHALELLRGGPQDCARDRDRAGGT